MLGLLNSGQYAVVALLIIALIISLTFHEFAHAASAKYFGDDTAQKLGRLNINPLAHIDPIGLAMVVMVGFGYAKPVPTNPRNFKSRWAVPMVAAAGPAMNLLLAFISWNVFQAGLNSGNPWFAEEGPRTFFYLFAATNVLLMLFNLIPLGPLDGHYIVAHLLPNRLARTYLEYNSKYGHYLFLGLILISIAGVPIFDKLMGLTRTILPKLAIVG